jgi:two-component system, cell cycle response regulator
VPACVLFADLDHFKQVNDVYGHPIGDAALRSAADCLRRAVRPADPVGRFGGEEFVVLLPSTDLMEAEEVAERIRALIEASPLQLVDGRSVSLSISLGVTLMAQDEPLTVAVDRADRAMLLAKRSGRNRVISLPSATLY